MALPALTRRAFAIVSIAVAADCAGAAGQKHSKRRSTTGTGAPGNPAQRHALAARLATLQALDEGWTVRALNASHRLPDVRRLILPAATPSAKNWRGYRARFVEPRRIAAGVRFWQAHATLLEQAQERYGVPAAIVLGVLGVETIWGQDMGKLPVLDSLATLALEFPQEHPRAAERQAFFESELGHYLTLCREQGWSVRKPLGSYAGAMGMPQFMPSSVRRFAVDFDGDGHIDLTRNAADAIGSVAHYLQQHGWQPGLATHHAVQFEAGRLDLESLLLPDILPTFSPTAMQRLGVLLPEAAQTEPGKLALVELRNGDEAPSYVAGTQNFYTLTRYNWSSYYAMAVIELGEAVQQAWRG